LFVFFFSKGNAQERISVDTSVELALQNNFKIKNENYVPNLQQMTRTAYDISNTGITGEYGQFNSSVNDFKIGISKY
jgi:cobalt-zinc-cadmium resistance protein CzcA